MSDKTANVNPSVALHTAILEERNARNVRSSGIREHFYASSLGMCPLKQIAERAGLPPTNPPNRRAEFKMWTGMVLGKQLATLLESVGYLDPAWTEKSLAYKSYTGRPDGLTHALNGSAIVEIKTTDDRAVQKDDWPEHYLWQAMFYALASGIPTVLLFMVGKNQGLAKHRVVMLDEAWTRAIDQEIARMDGLWELYSIHHQLPGHEHRFQWEDRWCPMLATEASSLQEELADG